MVVVVRSRVVDTVHLLTGPGPRKTDLREQPPQSVYETYVLVLKYAVQVSPREMWLFAITLTVHAEVVDVADVTTAEIAEGATVGVVVVSVQSSVVVWRG
jgi:hypothetical protein